MSSYALCQVDEGVKIFSEGHCATKDLNIPETVSMYRIQAKGFLYGGKVPHLQHVYEAYSTDQGYMYVTLLNHSPTTARIQDNEVVIAHSVRYQGMLLESGLVEYLARPVRYFYSPPVVDIVRDSEGSVRAILVDAAYLYLDVGCDATLNSMKEQIVIAQRQNEHEKAEKAYNEYYKECSKLLTTQ